MNGQRFHQQKRIEMKAEQGERSLSKTQPKRVGFQGTLPETKRKFSLFIAKCWGHMARVVLLAHTFLKNCNHHDSNQVSSLM